MSSEEKNNDFRDLEVWKRCRDMGKRIGVGPCELIDIN